MIGLPRWRDLRLRTKLALLLEGLVLALGVGAGLLVTRRMQATLEDELTKRGLAIARDLALFSVRPLLAEMRAGGGPLLVEGWWRAKRNLREVISRLGRQASIQEEKTRMLFREHFFDLEEEVKARALKPIARDLKQAILRKREKEGLLALFPGKNCAACGAPDCATLAEDILEGSAVPEDCVFVKLDRLSGTQPAGGGKARGDSRAKARPGPRGAEGPTGEP